MFGGISEVSLPAWAIILRDLGAAFLTGLAVKLMDDFLDAPLDRCRGQHTIAQRLGSASLPYALIVLALGAALNPPWAVSLFLASYALGMAGDLGRRVPSGMTGYQEALLGLGACMLLFGLLRALAAFSVILAIQVADDLRDWKEDRLAGGGLITRRLGLIETTLALAVSGSVALSADARMAIITWIAAGAVSAVMRKRRGVVDDLLERRLCRPARAAHRLRVWTPGRASPGKRHGRSPGAP